MSITSDILPGLGRNGIVNSVRKMSGSVVTGYRPVDPTAQFIAGMVATLVDHGNGPVASVANNTSTNLLGLFFCHKTVSFYRPIVAESQTFTGNTINLNHANILASYVKVTNATGLTTYTVTTDYTINATNGIITRVGGGAIGATDTVLVTYRYKDANLTGIDQTLGSGNAAVLEEMAEVATLVYDTSRTYVINTKLYVNADGIITNAVGSCVVGIVTNAPSNDDPNLYFKMHIAIN